jgi:hypothetical protein
MRWITGYRPIPFTRTGTITSFILHLEQLACPKFVVPYGQLYLLGPLPLQHPSLATRMDFSELVRTLGEDMASSVLLYIVPKDQISATFASRPGKFISTQRRRQLACAGCPLEQVRVALSPRVPRNRIKLRGASDDNRSSPGHSAEKKKVVNHRLSSANDINLGGDKKARFGSS